MTWDSHSPLEILTPEGHTNPLLVTRGGHHWRHTPPPFNRMTETCENIIFPQMIFGEMFWLFYDN